MEIDVDDEVADEESPKEEGKIGTFLMKSVCYSLEAFSGCFATFI